MLMRTPLLILLATPAAASCLDLAALGDRAGPLQVVLPTTQALVVIVRSDTPGGDQSVGR